MTSSAVLVTLLTLLALGLAVAVLTNQTMPVLSSDRVAFFGILALGAMLCALGAGPIWQSGQETLRVLGIVGGTIILLLTVMVTFGWTSLFAPFAAIAPGTRGAAYAGDRGAFILLAFLMSAKILVALIYRATMQ
jgi:hypothetical protein